MPLILCNPEPVFLSFRPISYLQINFIPRMEHILTYIKFCPWHHVLPFPKRCSLLLNSSQTDIAYLMFILLFEIKLLIRDKNHCYQQSLRHRLSNILNSFTQIRPKNTEAVMLVEFEFRMRVCENNENAFSSSHFPRFFQFILLCELVCTVGHSLFPLVTSGRECGIIQTDWGSWLDTKM